MSQPVLRRGRAAGFRLRQGYGGQVVAPQLQISLEYAPSSSQNREERPAFAGCLAIGPAALAIPCLIHFSDTL